MKLFMVMMFFLIALSGCQGLQPSPVVSPIGTTASSPRWIIYEQALSTAIINTDDGLCEWEILGRSGKQVYIWAECKARGSIGTSGSVPAVIYLGENDTIAKVSIPRDGNYYSQDIQSLFPADIQEKVYHPGFDGSKAEKHIDERLKSGGPPLIYLSSTPLP